MRHHQGCEVMNLSVDINFGIYRQTSMECTSNPRNVEQQTTVDTNSISSNLASVIFSTIH